jgi:predicted dehydrogenase
MFDGDSELHLGPEPEQITKVELTGPTHGRGTGVLEMAQAIREGRKVRIPGEIALHVLDIMISISEAIESKTWVEVKSTLAPIEALPVSWDPADATLS